MSPQQDIFAEGNSPQEFLQLPTEVQKIVMSYLDATTLARMGSLCKELRAFDKATKLRLVETIAREVVIQKYGKEEATRWRCANANVYRVLQLPMHGVVGFLSGRIGHSISRVVPNCLLPSSTCHCYYH